MTLIRIGVLVVSLILVGCSDMPLMLHEEVLKNQELALQEYLQENAILEEPIILNNVNQYHVESDTFVGLIKFKFNNSKKVQSIACTSIKQPIGETVFGIFHNYTYTIFCGL
ncbi:MAG: hypothetical protein ACM31H_01095 [Nitrososphaerales archaeon]